MDSSLLSCASFLWSSFKNNLLLVERVVLKRHPDTTAVSPGSALLSSPHLPFCLFLSVQVLGWLPNAHTLTHTFNNIHAFVPACTFLGNIQGVAACLTVRIQYRNTANDEYEVSENHQNNTLLNQLIHTRQNKCCFEAKAYASAF